MTKLDLLTLLEEGIQNGRIAPHLLTYIAAELHNPPEELAPEDQDARVALTPADQKALQRISVD
jgi:hypothetical protein